MPDPGPPRKLRWAGLWAPFLIAGLLVAGWSAGWIYAARQVEARLERGVAELRASGTEVAWSSKRLSGYPFRLNLALSDLRVAGGDWVVEAPDLEAQAFLQMRAQLESQALAHSLPALQPAHLDSLSALVQQMALPPRLRLD